MGYERGSAIWLENSDLFCREGPRGALGSVGEGCLDFVETPPDRGVAGGGAEDVGGLVGLAFSDEEMGEGQVAHGLIASLADDAATAVVDALGLNDRDVVEVLVVSASSGAVIGQLEALVGVAAEEAG